MMDTPRPLSAPADPDTAGIISAPAATADHRAQLSDSLRLLAPTLHTAIDRLLAHFSPAAGDAGSTPGCREELAQLCQQLDQLINVMQVVEAHAATQLLSRLRALLVHCAQGCAASELQLSSAQAAAAVTALWSLHDYLDDLHDRSGDTDIFDPGLFQGWRLICLQLPAGVHRPLAPLDSLPASLAHLHDLDVMLQVLDALVRSLAAAQSTVSSDDAALHSFVAHILDGLQPLDRHALAVLEKARGPLFDSRIEALRQRADWSPSLALVQAPESPVMVRLMVQVDEMQAAWGGGVAAASDDARAASALQWMGRVLVAADLARRIWPRLREPGLSGVLRSLGRLAGMLDPAACARTASANSAIARFSSNSACVGAFISKRISSSSPTASSNIWPACCMALPPVVPSRGSRVSCVPT